MPDWSGQTGHANASMMIADLMIVDLMIVDLMIVDLRA